MRRCSREYLLWVHLWQLLLASKCFLCNDVRLAIYLSFLQYGWCGSTDLYCGKGCNAKFGKCNQATIASSIRSSVKSSSSIRASSPTDIPSTLPVSSDARCGSSFGGKTCLGSRWGDCCSQYNWCGSSKGMFLCY
jgi:hypothetical protein